MPVRARAESARPPYAAALVALLATMLGACGGGGGGHAPAAREWQDPGQARQGEWTLYWNADPTADLDPAVANAYGVERRPRGAIVTVSLVRDLDPRAAAAATVEIGARTLLGQPRTVQVKRVERDGVVSWLGQLDVQDREQLVFSLSARVPGQSAPLVAEFRREFYVGD